MNSTTTMDPVGVAMSVGMDAATYAHLDAYLSSYCDREYAARLACDMIRAWSKDRAYWSRQGWRAVREYVGQ